MGAWLVKNENYIPEVKPTDTMIDFANAVGDRDVCPFCGNNDPKYYAGLYHYTNECEAAQTYFEEKRKLLGYVDGPKTVEEGETGHP